MAKKIRDTIHGYIYLTKVEEAISQHPLVLRMHHIHQTSFTYLTYPNAHSTRYPHSLGVMHIAGEIFLSAVSNSPQETLSHLAGLVSRFLNEHFPEQHEAIVAQVAQMQDGSGSSTDGPAAEPLYRLPIATARSNEKKARENAANIVLLFQAVRLAALLHDVGHPPFSHVVEYGLLQGSAGRYEGHEKIGAKLIKLMRQDAALQARSGFNKAPEFANAALALCEEILHGGEESQFWGIERSLLSGPIDADRLDYVRRDAYAAGMVPTYDIRRLVDAAFIRSNSDDKLEIGYRPNCLSSIENFFLARYDLYRYMIYHHDVVRRNLAVQRLLATVFDKSLGIDQRIKDAGERFIRCATGEAHGHEYYARFVDSHFLNLLWEIQDLIGDSEDGVGTPIGHLRLYLDLVLRRRNDRLRTLLKRPDDYAAFAKKLFEGTSKLKLPKGSDPVPHLNHLLKEKLKKKIEAKKSNGLTGDIAQNISKFELAQEIDRKLNEQVKDGSRFFSYYIGTFSAGPRREVKFSDPGRESRVAAEDVSPTITMLEQAWNFSPQLLIFFHMPQGGASVAEEAEGKLLRPLANTGLQAFLASP